MLNADSVNQILRLQQRFESDRATHEAAWQEIAERILPRLALFQIKNSTFTKGEKRTERIFDSTACLALDKCAAAIESICTPRLQRWHKMSAIDPELRDNYRVNRYLDDVTDVLFDARYAPKSNFASQMNECYTSLSAFGTAGLFIDDLIGQGLRYINVPLMELFFSLNYSGIVDMVHRKFNMTLRQLIQKFGADKISKELQDKAKIDPESEVVVLHCVAPREDRIYGNYGSTNMPFSSTYICVDTKTVLHEGGYRTLPYAVMRYNTGWREAYGRGPAGTVIADVKMVNEMAKTILQAGQMSVRPPLLMFDDGVLQAFDLRPGSLNYGGVNAQGQQLVRPLESGSRLDIGVEMLDQHRRVINDGFLVTLFQILVETPSMTATEALLRAQEKGQLLAPTMGRVESEGLSPTITRELDVLWHAGALPEPPEELIDNGRGIKIQYTSPMALAQQASKGIAILNTIQAVAPLAQIDPGAMMVFDAEKTVRELCEINGVPTKILRSEEEMASIKQQQAAQQQAQQLLEAAPVAASAAKDLAALQQGAGQVPGPLNALAA